MKRINLLLAALVCSVASMAQTKTTTATTKITDEDLKKYAMTQDSVKGMQETLLKIIAEQVQHNTVMEVPRYNELYKIEKDPAKLKAANATEAEISFLNEIADLRAWNTKRINATYQALAKDYVGLKTFNAIKKGLETDSELKGRFDNINTQLQSQQTTAPSDSKGK